MLPCWIRPVGAGRTTRREPWQRRRGHADPNPQPKPDSARHGDTWPDHSDDPTAADCDWHAGPNTDDHVDEHARAIANRDRDGQSNPDTRVDAFRDRLGDRHEPGDPDLNSDRERDRPGSHPDVHPDCHPTAAHPNTATGDSDAAAAHADGATYPNASANESSPGVDFAP